MENQPTNPAGPGPIIPNEVSPTPNQPPTPTPSVNMTSNPGVAPVVDPPKKKRKGLTAVLITLAVLLVLGGGAFAVAYIVSNQPANIAASAINNLLNAKQVIVDGSVDLSITDNQLGLQSLNFDFDTQATETGQTTTANINAKFTDGTEISAVNLGGVIMQNGSLYLKASGLSDAYSSSLSDKVTEYVTNNYIASYDNSIINLCREYSNDTELFTQCLSSADLGNNPAARTALENMIKQTTDVIGEVVNTIDGQWIEISVDDVLNHEVFASLSASERQSINNMYDCVVDKRNNFTSYGNELSNLYSQNSFLVMNAGQNSFYDISLDASNLANYLNAISRSRFASDLAACANTSTDSISTNITANDVANITSQLPSISAKFDGIFNHHLTELKINDRKDAYTLTSDLKFSYPNNINVAAPGNTRPVTDIINDISQQIQSLERINYSI